MVKNFKNQDNQKLWDEFYIKNIEELNKPKMSINQYKPVLLELEELIENKRFSTVTVSDLNKLEQIRQGKNISHARGFIMNNAIDGKIKVNKDVLSYLIPTEYKKIVELLMA